MTKRLKTLEKLCYLVGVPVLLTFGGYTIYQKAKQGDEERSQIIA